MGAFYQNLPSTLQRIPAGQPQQNIFAQRAGMVPPQPQSTTMPPAAMPPTMMPPMANGAFLNSMPSGPATMPPAISALHSPGFGGLPMRAPGFGGPTLQGGPGMMPQPGQMPTGMYGAPGGQDQQNFMRMRMMGAM